MRSKGPEPLQLNGLFTHALAWTKETDNQSGKRTTDEPLVIFDNSNQCFNGCASN